MFIGYPIDQIIDIHSLIHSLISYHLPICTFLYDMYQAVLLQPIST